MDQNAGGYRIGDTKGLNGHSGYRKQLYYLGGKPPVGKASLPSGVQRNMPRSKLTGWVKYFDQAYNHKTKQADLTNGLPGGATHIMVCGSKAGNPATIMLCAAAKKADVLRKTGSTSSASGPYNGVYWYNYQGKSFGFSDSKAIQLSSADVRSGSGRLSWHMDQNAGGYRIGDTKGLNGHSGYRKQLYYAKN